MLARIGRYVLVVSVLAPLAGCGTSSSSSSNHASTSAASTATPTVFAAASLSRVFPRLEPGAKFTFGGSGTLETQIQQGAPADVYASASPKQAEALYAHGLVEKPEQFATNRLVLIVPKGNPAHISAVGDITKPGVKLVICQASVPCGDYARKAFTSLGITKAALANVASQTSDVTQTVAEVALGQADAGFVYVTDAQAAAGKVLVIPLPKQAKPQAKDVIAVVKAAKHPAAAQSFVGLVLSPAGQAKLRAAGFAAP